MTGQPSPVTGGHMPTHDSCITTQSLECKNTRPVTLKHEVDKFHVSVFSTMLTLGSVWRLNHELFHKELNCYKKLLRFMIITIYLLVGDL